MIRRRDFIIGAGAAAIAGPAVLRAEEVITVTVKVEPTERMPPDWADWGAQAPWSGTAVLYRTNAQSAPLEGALRAAGVPYRVRGAARFLDRRQYSADPQIAELANQRDRAQGRRAPDVDHVGTPRAHQPAQRQERQQVERPAASERCNFDS